MTSSPLDAYELDPESLHETMAASLLGSCGGLDGGEELRRRAEEQSKKTERGVSCGLSRSGGPDRGLL